MENDLESRLTPLGDQASSSATAASTSNFSYTPILRVNPPSVGGVSTVASYLSFNAQGGDRVFAGYKIRGTGFGGGIDILDADNPDSLTSVNSVRSSNLDVQEVVDDPVVGDQYVAGALETNLGSSSPAALVKLTISSGGNSVSVDDKRLSANVAKSVVNAPSSDSRHDFYVVTDGNSIFTPGQGDPVQDFLLLSGPNFASGFTLEGTFTLSWDSPPPENSALAFQIKGYDGPDTPNQFLCPGDGNEVD